MVLNGVQYLHAAGTSIAAFERLSVAFSLRGTFSPARWTRGSGQCRGTRDRDVDFAHRAYVCGLLASWNSDAIRARD